MTTPTLDEAFAQATADQATAETEETLTSKEEAETQPAETEVKDFKATEDKPETKVKESEETKEETFAEKGELTGRTPEEMEETYKNWQRAYTTKRQAERKELEETNYKLEQLTKELEALKSKPQETQDKPLSEMSPEEYAAKVAEMAKSEVQISGDNAYIEAQEKAFYALDDRLQKDSPTEDTDLRDLVMMRLSNAREEWEAQGKPIREFDFLGKAKEYIEAFDSRIKNSNQAFLKKQGETARTRADDFAKESPKTSDGKTKPKKMDLDEALNAALEG